MQNLTVTAASHTHTHTHTRTHTKVRSLVKYKGSGYPLQVTDGRFQMTPNNSATFRLRSSGAPITCAHIPGNEVNLTQQKHPQDLSRPALIQTTGVSLAEGRVGLGGGVHVSEMFGDSDLRDDLDRLDDVLAVREVQPAAKHMYNLQRTPQPAASPHPRSHRSR